MQEYRLGYRLGLNAASRQAEVRGRELDLGGRGARVRIVVLLYCKAAGEQEHDSAEDHKDTAAHLALVTASQNAGRRFDGRLRHGTKRMVLLGDVIRMQAEVRGVVP